MRKSNPKPPSTPGRKPGRQPRPAARVMGPRLPTKVGVLYEDEAIIAIDKPAGLTAVPVKNCGVPTAFAVLTEALQDKRQRVFIVHRIDRFTSGVLLFAKTERDREILVRQFLAHEPVRQYLSVVRGHLKSPEGTLVHYFKREGMVQKLRTESDPNATRAELKYKVERELKAASVVRSWLVTGLQNQIRVQFAALGHPVVGDRKYFPKEAEETRISRVALHAAHLEIKHPRTGKAIRINCPPPADFRSLIQRLAVQK
jgi:23S rRNA pseudouridine1911/1915/1917 synthase